MSTTFTAAYKNQILNSILGRASNNFILSHIWGYPGAQAASPSVPPPSGVYITATYTQGGPITANMTQPAGGVSVLSVPISTTAANTIAGTQTTARIFDESGLAVIDTPMTLAGGGGGVIVPTLTSSTGVAFVFTGFSFKLPGTRGTLMMNDALRDIIVRVCTVAAANIGFCSSAAIKIYSGSPPANANMAATGTLLATFTTAATGNSWNNTSAGSSSLVANLSVAAAATGAAGYARIEKGTYVLQGSVGTTGTDFVLDSTSLTIGVTTLITNATITL